MLFAALAILSVWIAGCRNENTHRVPPPVDQEEQPGKGHSVLTQKDIETAAVAEIVKRSSLRPDQLRASAIRQGNDWNVHVWIIPEIPGGFSDVLMSETGEVKEVIGGA